MTIGKGEQMKDCNRFLFLLIMLVLLPVIAGMGSNMGASSPDKIPVPDKKYSATFIDQMDVVTECTEVSFEGKTFLEGKRGEGTYTIPFEKITHIVFQLEDSKLKGIVKLKDGNKEELILNKDHKAYGLTQTGTFMINLSGLKKINVHQKAVRKE
jgi:hypothetical protein